MVCWEGGEGICWGRCWDGGLGGFVVGCRRVLGLGWPELGGRSEGL